MAKSARKDKKRPPLGTGERFRQLVESIKKRGSSYDPRAVAAAIGRRKYGKRRFQEMATRGRRRAVRRSSRA